MYRTADELINKGINLEKLHQVYNIINLGEMVYQDIIAMQSSIFKASYFRQELQRIRRATIYTQFEEGFLTKDFPFECKALKVNNFGLAVPEISDNNVIYHIVRTKEKGILPDSSKYRKEKALLNNFPSKQMMIEGMLEPRTISEKYYALITYGGEQKIEFVNLVIPDYNFSEVVAMKDLTDMNRMFINKTIETDKNMTERRMKLKEEVLKKIRVEGV